MMRALACLLALLCIAQPLRAETISIRSGNHSTFARLVLSIPPGAEWQLGRSGSSYALQMAPIHDFDLAQAFARIPRDRVQDLIPARPGRLDIALGCECHAEAFLYQSDFLVIDIIDGPPPAGSPFEVALDAPDLRQDQPRLPSGAILPLLPDRQAVALPLPDSFQDLAANERRVTAAELALVESLARAASQGVLDLPSDFIEPTPRPEAASPEPDAMPPEEMEASVALPEAEATRPGVMVESVMDRDRPQAASVQTNANGDPCLDDSLFDVASWTEGNSYQVEIGQRLSALTSEFDRFGDGAPEALARTYIAFGFGREAVRALEVDGVRSREREIISTMGYLVDGDTPPSNPIADQAGCARPVALWLALLRGTLEGTGEPEKTAIRLAHRALPTALRGHIGARLAELFVEAGDPGSAEEIFQGTRATPTADVPEADMAHAGILEQTEGTASAVEHLQEVAETDNRLTPEAVISLIDLTLQEGGEVPSETVDLVGSLRYEYRGTEMEPALSAAELAALIAAGRLEEARPRLGTDHDALAPEDLDRLRTDLVLAMVASQNDAEFLETAFGGLPPDPSVAARNSVARRLLDLGFPDKAMELLDVPATGADDEARRYLLAEAAIQMRNESQVAEVLAGLDTPTADALRAEAGLGDPAADGLGAFRAGDVAALSQSEDALMQAVASALTEGPAALEGTPTLASGETLLEQAQSTRSLAEDLLTRFPQPPPAESP